MLRANLAMLLVLLIFIQFSLAKPLLQETSEYVEVARLGRGNATTLDWRPDGVLLAVGGSAGIWLFDENFQQVAHHLMERVRFVQWSPDGERLGVLFQNGRFVISQVSADGLTIAETLEIEGIESEFEWSPDGSRITTTSVNYVQGVVEGFATIWDAGSSEQILRIPDIISLDWSPDSRQLAGITIDHEAGIWDALSGDLLKLLPSTDENMFFEEAAFNNTGSMVYISSYTSLYLWNPSTDELQTQYFAGITVGFYGMRMQPQGTAIAGYSLGINGSQGAVMVFENIVSEPASIYAMDYVIAFVWTPNGNKITSLLGSGLVINSNRSIRENTEQYQLFTPISYALWSPDSTQLAVASSFYGHHDEYPVSIWEMPTSGETTILYDPNVILYPILSLREIAWTPDSQEVVTTADNLSSLIAQCLVYQSQSWDVSTGEMTDLYYEFGVCGLNGAPEWLWDFAADWNSDFSLIAEQSGNAVFLRPALGESQLSFETSGIVYSIAWSPDDAHILTLSKIDDESVRFIEIWDATSGEQLFSTQTTASMIRVQWSPESQYISLITDDENNYSLEVFDVATGNVQVGRDYETQIFADWNHDGSKLAVSIDDINDTEGIEILDVGSDAVLQTLNFDEQVSIAWHTIRDMFAISRGEQVDLYQGDEVIGSIPSQGSVLSWSPDGRMLLIRNPSGTLSVWRASE